MKVKNIKYNQSYPLDGLIKNLIKNDYKKLKWILLGTGNPLSGYSRAKSSNVLLAGENIILVDCGAGVVRRLIMAGISPNQISHLFFTHHHADHNGGFFDFFSAGIFSRETLKRQVPLMVYGPTNTQEVIGKMRESLNIDFQSRKSFNEYSNKIIYHELNNGVIYNHNDLKVIVFKVNHGNIKPSVGYKFLFEDKVIVYSGDTAPCENIEMFSKDADLLIHESYNMELINQTGSIYGNSDTGRGFKENVFKHSSTIEVAKLAKKANVKHIVLTHHIPSITPTLVLEKKYIKGMSNIYSGKITMGRDLMMIY